MERKEAIRSAYHMTGSNSFYDGMMTCSTLPGRAVCRLVWDMNRQDCVRYQEKAVSGIPEDFAGRLLEVPVGTGILTMPLYRTLPRAEITCLDYSPDMMAQAQEKARRMHLGNVAFRQGDVGALKAAALTRCSHSTGSTPFRIRRRPIGRYSACFGRAACSAAASM